MIDLVHYLVPRNRDEEDDDTRTLNDVTDHAFQTYAATNLLRGAGQGLREHFLPTEHERIQDAMERLEFKHLAESEGLDPREALDNDFLDEPAKSPSMGMDVRFGRNVYDVIQRLKSKNEKGLTTLEALGYARKPSESTLSVLRKSVR